jgi:hypothetical protein
MTVDLPVARPAFRQLVSFVGMILAEYLSPRQAVQAPHTGNLASK